MKRTIIIEVLLLLILAVLIACTSMAFIYVTDMNYHITQLSGAGLDNPQYQLIEGTIKYYKGNTHIVLSFAVPTLVAALCDLAAMVLIALHNFPCFKPLIDKLAAKRAAQKQATATAKAEKAETAKQARIEQLTAELNELKKDE